MGRSINIRYYYYYYYFFKIIISIIIMHHLAVINIANYPGILSFYMPDRIEAVDWRGESYVITANEGQSQLIAAGITEAIRAGTIPRTFLSSRVVLVFQSLNCYYYYYYYHEEL